ncbi:DNA polymerase III subunit delta [bacterium]|nr:DNA polymerase III subunit delta [candidate division CSSED10-310 bacterium]
MMTDKHSPDIQTVLSAIRNGRIHPIYIVSGSEDYLVFKSRHLITESLLELIPEGALETLSGHEHSMAEIVSRLNSPSLFEPFKVVMVRDAPYFKAKLPESEEMKILDWLERTTAREGRPPAVLLCACDKIDKRMSLLRQIAQKGIVLEFKSPETYERGDLQRDPYYPVVRDHLRNAGTDIERNAWFTLRQRVTNNLWAVINAVDTLIAFSAGQPRIRESDVLDLVAAGDETPAFAVTEALGKRDVNQLRNSLENLLTTGTSPLMILKMLSSRIRILLAVKTLLSGIPGTLWREEMEYWQFRKSALPEFKKRIDSDPGWSDLLSRQHPYALFQTLRQSGQFESRHLEKCLMDLSEIDLALKSTTKSPLVMMEMALLPLCRAGT